MDVEVPLSGSPVFGDSELLILVMLGRLLLPDAGELLEWECRWLCV